jgi:pilus assembly protein CpaF
MVLNRVVGLGPLKRLIADENVTEIMVNRFNEIFVEKKWAAYQVKISFTNDAAVIAAIRAYHLPSSFAGLTKRRRWSTLA